MGTVSNPLWNAARLSAVAVTLLTASVLGFRSPGLYYDEAIFFNGAVQMLNSGQEPSFAHDQWSWVTAFGRRWPVMVMPYAGAVRDYLALPLFAIFGPTYYSARILTTLVGAFAIWALSVLMRDRIGVEAAAIAALALAIHPAYLLFTMYDQGVAEWMAPFGALAFTLARYLRAPSAGRAFWLGAAMGFGVWSRANIVWLLGSAALAGVIVYGKRLLLPGRHAAALAAGGLVGGAPLIWYEIRSGGATFAFVRTASDPESLWKLAGLRLPLLCGTIFPADGRRSLWNGPPAPLWFTILFCAVVFTAIYICLRNVGQVDNLSAIGHRALAGRAANPPQVANAPHIAFGRASALTCLLLLACMFLSRLNVSDHHFIALVPLAMIPVTVAAMECRRRWPGARRWIALLALAYFGCALYWDLSIARRLRSTGGVDLWSNAINTLENRLERDYRGRNIKVLDWGLTNNLFVLSNARIAPLELVWGASPERSGSGKLWKDEITPGDIYVLHAPALTQFPAAGDAFRRALARSSLPHRTLEIHQDNGAGYAETVEILPTKEARTSAAP